MSVEKREETIVELKRIGIARTPSGVRSIPIRLIENDIAFQKSDVNFFCSQDTRFFATHKTAASD